MTFTKPVCCGVSDSLLVTNSSKIIRACQGHFLHPARTGMSPVRSAISHSAQHIHRPLEIARSWQDIPCTRPVGVRIRYKVIRCDYKLFRVMMSVQDITCTRPVGEVTGTM